MTSDNLTREQLRKVGETLTPMLGYLSRLAEHMERAGFAADDPLLAKVFGAKDAMQALSMDLHYRGCSGVGRPAK